MAEYIDKADILMEIGGSMDMQDLYLPSHFIDLLENVPDADVIEQSKIEEAITEIDRKIKSGQWSDSVTFGMAKAIYILKKHIGK